MRFIVLGWLPTLLRDRGLDVLNASIVGSSVDPGPNGDGPSLFRPLRRNTLSPRLLILLVWSATCAGFLALLYAPLSTRLIWALILGLGPGSLFGPALLFVTSGLRPRG